MTPPMTPIEGVDAMTPIMKPARGCREDGGAIVEFALLSTILVPTLLYGIFLLEASRAKIKTTEAARYLVWEMTVVGLSDWDGGNHDARFNSVKTSIMSEVAARWGDDLESASPEFTKGKRATAGVTIQTVFDPNQVQLTNAAAGAYNATIAGADLGAVGNTIDAVLGNFKFNTKGKVDGKFVVKVKNIFLGKTMPIGYKENMLESNEFTLSSTQSLIADSWDLKQGGSVTQVQDNNENEGNKCKSHYCKQVSRMAFLGIAAGGAMGDVQGVIGFLGIHFPLSTVVASKAMVNNSPAKPSEDIQFPFLTVEGRQPVKADFTNVYTDRKPGKEKDSLYYKVFRRLGKNYMGCDKEERQEGNSPPSTAKCPYKAK
jgi:hypothetical protein